MARPIFDKYPALVSFRWKQYIPSFNDGDPCTFSTTDPVLGFSVKLFDKEPDDEDYYEDDDTGDDVPIFYYECWRLNVEDHGDLGKAADEIEEFLEAVGYEALEAMFDYNVRITVTPDEVVVEDGYGDY